MFQDLIRSLKLRLRAANRRRLDRRQARRAAMSYAQWVARHDTLTPALRALLQARAQAMSPRSPTSPLITVWMTVGQAEPQRLQLALDSLRSQLYPHWEVWLHIEAQTSQAVLEVIQAAQQQDPRIHTQAHALDASESPAPAPLGLAKGAWLAHLGEEDQLAEHALLVVAETVAAFPQARLLYSDEDQLGPEGQREAPKFKPDWNPELFRSSLYTGQLAVFDADWLRRVEGCRANLGGAEWEVLTALGVENLPPDAVVHIPQILYHRRGPWPIPNHQEAEPADGARRWARVMGEHLQRLGIDATVSRDGPANRVHYPLPTPLPGVSVIVPTRNALGLLRQCVESLLAKTDYPDLELIVVDNGSDEAATLAYLDQLRQRPRVQVLRDDGPFNYSALNNRAAALARGEYLCLMNNDIEVIQASWLREMVSLAARSDTGAVGARLWYPDGRLQHGGVILGVGDIAAHAHPRLGRTEPGYMGRAQCAQNFSAVTAACLVVRRASYLRVGGLDEQRLAVSFNDVDFCLRLQSLGLQTVWTPHAELIHHESATRKKDRQDSERQRYQREAEHMRTRWGPWLAHDPAYNPNLSLQRGDFSLSDAPRVSLSEPWFRTAPPPTRPLPPHPSPGHHV